MPHDPGAPAGARRFTGADPLALADTDTAWVVVEGEVSLFAVERAEGGALDGQRRFLGQFGAGQALFGAAAERFGLLAVPLGQATLAPLPFAEVARLAASGDARAEAWLTAWGSGVSAGADPASAALAQAARLGQAPLAEALTAQHARLQAGLAEVAEADRAARARRLRERAERDARSRSEAIAGLGALLSASRVVPRAGGEPLLAAMREAGRPLGLTLRPASRAEGAARAGEPLDAIARASHVRVRRVLLAGPWWREDNGPLVAFRSAGHAPVALLPVPGGYTCFDPAEGTHAPLTPADAAGFEPLAVMLYRRFPEGPIGVRALLRFATHGRAGDLAALVALGVAGTVFGMAAPQMTGLLIDQAIPDSDRHQLAQMAVALVLAALGAAIFSFSRGLLAQRMEGRADADTQSAVWDRVLNLAPPFFRRYTMGDLNNRVTAVGQIRRHLGGSTLQTLMTSLFSLLNLALMFAYSPMLTGVALALTALTVGVSSALALLKLRWSKPLRALEGQLHGLVIQLIQGTSKLRVAGAESRAFTHWAGYYGTRMKLRRDIQLAEDALGVFNQLMPILGSMALFAAGAAQAGAGGLATGTFLAFNAAFGLFLAATNGLSNTLISLLDLSNLWALAKPVLEAEPEVRPGQGDPGVLTGRFALDRVTFRYEEAKAPVLADLSLHAEPGEHIALVGPSGCGKSTIFRILLGFESPEEGLVTFDGQDLSTLDLRGVRRQLGVVLQNGKVTAAPIFENIAAGAILSLDEAWEAARMAGFDEDIKAMPMGMHTLVSEGGANLSGGQRQRLLIARALALKPRLILFDEATSALDNHTQAIVSRSLEELRVTRISIAHRLSTIRHADRIYVLEGGRVVQRGTFDELAAQEGLFKRLVERQAL